MKNGWLPIADRLRSRGATITLEWQLCNDYDESVEHIYFKCRYTNELMKRELEATGGDNSNHAKLYVH